MPPNKVGKPTKALIDEFCTITGVERVVADNLLEACNNNLEMAVNMHMEGMTAESAQASSSSAAPSNRFDDDNVRAPIPQKQEVLVEGHDNLAYTFRDRKRTTRSVFDKFRDFEAEAKRQEEELLANSECGEASSSWKSSKEGNRYQKKKTLEDLFRPPVDLMFRGTFQSARDAGSAEKKWLLVNVQDSSEFPCQVLNRDVWSNTAVKAIVKEHFIFWQLYHDSEEGQRYMMFYKITEWPYVAVVDPRTGECLATWHKLDAMSFCDIITEFLSSHTNLEETINEDLQTPSKKPKLESEPSIMEADEDAQLEAAIKASLADNDERTKACPGVQNNEEEDHSDNLETFDSDPDDVDYSLSNNIHSAHNGDIKETIRSKVLKSVSRTKSNHPSDTSASNSVLYHEECMNNDKSEISSNSNDLNWKTYLGLMTDPESELMLRMPDGSRDFITMPSSSKLMALVLYVASKGYSNESFEMITNFPRRKISYLDFNISLKEAGLYPKETVFVQAR